MQALERSYCLVSCGGAPLSVIQHYIYQPARSAVVAADQPTPPSEPLRAYTGSTGWSSVELEAISVKRRRSWALETGRVRGRTAVPRRLLESVPEA